MECKFVFAIGGIRLRSPGSMSGIVGDESHLLCFDERIACMSGVLPWLIYNGQPFTH